MTRDQFEAFMTENNWHLHQRDRWQKITPTCDVPTFLREMSRPDGVIEVTFERDGHTAWLRFKCFWEKLQHLEVEGNT